MANSSDIQREIDSLQTTYTSKSRDLDNLNKQMQDISAKVTSQQADVVDLQGRIAQKTDALNQARADEAKRLKEEAEAAQQKADAAQQEANRLASAA